jgi:lysophospholipase L1-like esterase
MPSNDSFSRRLFLNTAVGTLAAPFVLKGAAPDSDEKEADFTVLFQGDSITDGNRGRDMDPNHILGHGYAFAIASELGSSFPERNLKFINRGVSGDKVSDLVKRWKTDALDLSPSVLSILVGINDIHQAISRNEPFNANDFESQYRQLLDNTLKIFPNIEVILGEPFILPVGMVEKEHDRWRDFVSQAQERVRRVASRYETLFVPYQSAFEEALKKAEAGYWIWDGIHPTYSGHGVMKRAWLKTAKGISKLKQS